MAVAPPPQAYGAIPTKTAPPSVNPAKNAKAAGPVNPATGGASADPKSVNYSIYTGNDKASIVRQQKYLQSLGYNVKPDGNRGKFTNSAWDAYTHGNMGPSQWNSFITKHFNADGSPVTAAASTTTDRTAADAGGGDTTDTRTTSGTTAPATSPAAQLEQTLAALGISLKGLAANPINPVQYAKSAVGAEYDPQIAGVNNQILQTTRQGTQNQTDIQNWYNQLLSDSHTAATANTDALKTALAGQDQAAQGAVAAAGGGAAAGNAAAWANINRGQLTGLGLNQAGYDNSLPAIFGLQGVDAQVRNTNQNQSDLQGLRSQLVSLQGAKGKGYDAALSDAYTQAQNQAIAGVNAKAQLALLPSQLAQSGLDTTIKGQTVDDNAIQYKMDLAKLKLAQSQLGTNGAVPNWGQLNPNNLQGLQNQLVSAVVAKGNPSQLAVDPARVFNSWGNELRTFSNGKWDPHANTQINQWRNGILASFLPAWNQAHPKRQYALKSGQLFLNGKQVSNV